MKTHVLGAQRKQDGDASEEGRLTMGANDGILQLHVSQTYLKDIQWRNDDVTRGQVTSRLGTKIEW